MTAAPSAGALRSFKTFLHSLHDSDGPCCEQTHPCPLTAPRPFLKSGCTARHQSPTLLECTRCPVVIFTLTPRHMTRSGEEACGQSWMDCLEIGRGSQYL